jgi:hypothetical protein
MRQGQRPWRTRVLEFLRSLCGDLRRRVDEHDSMLVGHDVRIAEMREGLSRVRQDIQRMRSELRNSNDMIADHLRAATGQESER